MPSSNGRQSILSLLLPELNVFEELVLQVINDVCCENFNLVLISKSLSFLGDSHIKCKDGSKLLLLALLVYIKSFHCLQYIVLVNWADGDVAHWNFLVKQELQESFEGTEGRGLNADTFRSLIYVLFHDVY